MSNRIRISCEFSFKGEYLRPSLDVDLDRLMEHHAALPDFYPMLAEANGIGLYTYEFEILEAESLQVEALDGWVGACIVNQCLDIDSFERRWHETYIQMQLQNIVEKFQLPSDHAVLDALKAAYQLGCAKR